MENSANVLRIALIVSIVGHVVFFALSAHDLRPTTHGESMDVQLVPANEVPGTQEHTGESANASGPKDSETKTAEATTNTSPPEPKTESKPEPAKLPDTPAAAKPEPKGANPAKPQPPARQPQPAAEQKPTAMQPQRPADQKPPAMQPQPQQQMASAPAAEAQQPAPAPPEATPEDINRVASMLGLPFSREEDSGTQAERMSKLTEGVKEFKAQVKRCLKLPSGIAPDQKIKMVIRVALTRNGALARDPEVIDAANPTIGLPLLQSVRLALTQCAPYRLPPDKYDAWKVLDIDFSPDQMTGS
jgi:outer membrane biosynthesis protein TonB